jgi:hypothetical protein
MNDVAKKVSNVLTSETAITGYFTNIEISFAIGDCVRTQNCIKINNVKKIGETHQGFVPQTITLSDGRLNIDSDSRNNIRTYFSTLPESQATPPSRKHTKDINTRRGNFAAKH